ncbi:MAG: 4Fe-4S dicluster domain-containing protein [Desulfovibrio sp.]|nr:4Fe-4S dicluster domain-containing protein [Desulfovibrio sp.]
MNAIPTEAGPELEAVRDMMRSCIQCGTCTASCPNAAAMDVSPRRLWRLLLTGHADEALASRSFWLCSSCYACTLRCPRGLPLTEAMAALKRLASRHDPAAAREGAAFYGTFMDNVRRNGRVQETDLMGRYFWAMKNPLLPLTFAPLGLRLLAKGKLHRPATEQRGRLGPMFATAAKDEGDRS